MKQILRTLLFIVITLSPFLFSDAKGGTNDPGSLSLTVTLPEEWKSYVQRQDYENQSVFSFNANGEQAFLFSVTKVTSDQWLMLKDQIQGATIIQNQGGYIVFVQKNREINGKGNANDQYQQALRELDTVIQKIRIDIAE